MPEVVSRPIKSCTIVGIFMIGGRVCTLYSFLKPNEKAVSGRVMIERGIEFEANMRQIDGEFFDTRKDEIPDCFHKLTFAFPLWLGPHDLKRVRYMSRRKGKWTWNGKPLKHGWKKHYVLVHFS